MKYWNLILMLFLLVSFQEKDQEPMETLASEGITPKNKEFLLNYFEETEDHLEEITEGLSEAQYTYKVADDRWSVMETLEHIVVTEAAIFKMTEELMAQEPDPDRRSEIKTTDEELIRGIEDRSKKAKASAELQPTGKFATPEQALDELEKQRQVVLKLINNTSEEDLRNHISDSPFGPIDGFQSLLFIAGHTARHTKQIEEVLADPGFPEE